MRREVALYMDVFLVLQRSFLEEVKLVCWMYVLIEAVVMVLRRSLFDARWYLHPPTTIQRGDLSCSHTLALTPQVVDVFLVA